MSHSLTSQNPPSRRAESLIRVLALIALLGAALVACQREPKPVPVRVAAASDLTHAFEALGKQFEQQTKQPVSFTFGSTGLMARQLQQGAPFDMFAAADVAFADQVVKAGACDGSTQALYGRGRIVIWGRKGRAPEPPKQLKDLAEARYKRIAIANPEHAPYGRAARAALKQAGVWQAVEPRLVLGENVRQTLQLAETGNADVAIVALALTVADQENPWALVDGDLHPHIDQALVVCTRGANTAGGRRFAEFVNSPEGRGVMRRYGFVLPGEQLTQNP